MQETEYNIDEGRLRELNEQMIKGDLITSDSIYIELPFFKDIYLGTLMTFLTKPTNPDLNTAESYQYILSRIPDYRKRNFVDMSNIFPDLKISNEMIADRINDPLFHDEIFRHSPSTQFLDTFRVQVDVIVNNSRVIKKRDTLKLYVNTYPLQLNKVSRNILGLFISSTYRVDVEVICRNPTTFELAELHHFDEMYLFYFKELMDNEATRQAFTELKFVDKHVYAARFFGYQVDDLKNLKQEALYVQTALDVLCNFKYIEMFRVSVPDIKKPSDA